MYGLPDTGLGIIGNLMSTSLHQLIPLCEYREVQLHSRRHVQAVLNSIPDIDAGYGSAKGNPLKIWTWCLDSGTNRHEICASFGACLFPRYRA